MKQQNCYQINCLIIQGLCLEKLNYLPSNNKAGLKYGKLAVICREWL